MQKLLSEIDLKVIDNKIELISDNSLEDKLIKNIEEFFKIEPKLLKDIVYYSNLYIKGTDLLFVYIVAAIISVFVF